MRFIRPEELRGLWAQVGLTDIATSALVVAEPYQGFEDYWQPFTTGVGPGGAYCAGLPADARDALRDECRRRLGNPAGPFRLRARAWAVRGARTGSPDVAVARCPRCSGAT